MLTLWKLNTIKLKRNIVNSNPNWRGDKPFHYNIQSMAKKLYFNQIRTQTYAFSAASPLFIIIIRETL